MSNLTRERRKRPVELRQPHPTTTEDCGSPSQATDRLETLSLIEPDQAGPPAESTPEDSDDWRGKLWATSRKIQWNWD